MECCKSNSLEVVVDNDVRMLQGHHLQRGSRLVDFDIRLGDSVCVPVSLTDNQVDCRPPTNRPNKDVNDTLCHGDTLSLKASDRRQKFNKN